MVDKNSTNEELKDIGVVIRNTKTIYLDKAGNECDTNNSVCKMVKTFSSTNESNINIFYYIKYRRGQLFDPYGIDALKINAYDTKYKKVDEQIYNKYVKYLNTRRGTFLLEATREFISKGY